MNPISEVYCEDCVAGMKRFPDNYFDLALIDTPYGIKEDGSKNHTRSKIAKAKNYKGFHGGDVSAPGVEYWNELFRVSKNQIIWGANHFIDLIPFRSSCWIVWDKLNGDNDFADCELAWTSYSTAVRKFNFRWAGMLQGNMRAKEIRIHPTQKPVALYIWLLENYAKPADKILDTHLGSQSSRIAAYKKGFDFWGFEIDADYFNDGNKRFKKEIAMPLFDTVQPQQLSIV